MTTQTGVGGVPPVVELPRFARVGMAAITLVDSEARYREAMDCMQRQSWLGFDTESKPTFAKGEVSTGPHLLQFATAERVFLVQSRTPFAAQIARAILGDAGIIKVGFGMSGDRQLLRARFDVEVASLVDLGVLLLRLRYPGPNGKLQAMGAKSAVQQVLGESLQKSKKTKLTNWALATLSPQQLGYAADDAMAAYRVYARLRTLHMEEALAQAYATPPQAERKDGPSTPAD